MPFVTPNFETAKRAVLGELPAEVAVARPRKPLVAALTVLAIFAFSCAIVGTAVRNHQPLFAYDEATYVDYLIKIDDGQLWMPRGDLYSQEAIQAVLCRGIAHPDEGEPAIVVGGQCDFLPRDPLAFLNGGVSTAAGHPPTYFLATYVGAKIVLATGVTEDLITAGRLVGAGWMAFGLIVMVALARELGARAPAIGLLVLTVGLTPKFVEGWQYVTPDAANLLAGSTVMLVAVRWLRRSCPLWWLALAGVLGTSIKVPNVLIVIASCLAILLAERSFRPIKERLVAIAALGSGMMAGGAAVALIATAIAKAGRDSHLDKAQYVASLTSRHLLDNLTAFIGPLARDGHVAQFSMLVFLLLVSLVVAAAFGLSKLDIRQPFAVSLLVLLVIGPSLLVVMVFVTEHQYFDIQQRYGYNLLPGAFAIASTYWRGWVRLSAVSAVLVPYCAFSLQTLF